MNSDKSNTDREFEEGAAGTIKAERMILSKSIQKKNQ